MNAILTAIVMVILTSSVEQVISAVSQLLSLAITCFEAVLGNPVLLLYVAAGIAGIAFAIFRKMKKAAR